MDVIDMDLACSVLEARGDDDPSFVWIDMTTPIAFAERVVGEGPKHVLDGFAAIVGVGGPY